MKKYNGKLKVILDGAIGLGPLFIAAFAMDIGWISKEYFLLSLVLSFSISLGVLFFIKNKS